MPLPINKVKDNMSVKESNNDNFDLLNLIQISPMFLLGFQNSNSEEKKALNDIWLYSEDMGNDRIKLSNKISNKTISMLKSRGFIKGDGNIIQITESGKKALKESILNDENSSFTKTASKKLIAKNSYDFGHEVLVRLNNADKFGTRYICLSKKYFSKSNLIAKNISKYTISAKNEDGSYKKLKDYNEEELIQILHMAKNVINNITKIAMTENPQYVPVHRLKEFCEIIMSELNRR
jgi:hypothetical protein